MYKVKKRRLLLSLLLCTSCGQSLPQSFFLIFSHFSLGSCSRHRTRIHFYPLKRNFRTNTSIFVFYKVFKLTATFFIDFLYSINMFLISKVTVAVRVPEINSIMFSEFSIISSILFIISINNFF